MAASTRRPTVLVTGDVAFLHDLGGLIAARGCGVPLCIVVLNNDGGRIFDTLPVAGKTEHFEKFFVTPHGLDFSHAAALAGARLHRPADAPALRDALAEGVEGGLHLVEVRS